MDHFSPLHSSESETFSHADIIQQAEQYRAGQRRPRGFDGDREGAHKRWPGGQRSSDLDDDEELQIALELSRRMEQTTNSTPTEPVHNNMQIVPFKGEGGESKPEPPTGDEPKKRWKNSSVYLCEYCYKEFTNYEDVQMHCFTECQVFLKKTNGSDLPTEPEQKTTNEKEESDSSPPQESPVPKRDYSDTYIN